jgi:transposase
MCNNVPHEYMHCFNIIDEIPEVTAMEVEEEVQMDLYETTALEWHEWQLGVDEKKPVKEAEPDIKRIMDFGSFQAFLKYSQETPIASQQEATTSQQVVESKLRTASKTTTAKKTRGPYRSYSALQVQELLDLVIEQGMSARQAGLTVGIVVRTAQHYVKTYKDDEEKRLPGTKKVSRLGGNNRKLEPKHTDFLCQYYDTAAAAVLWEARDALLSAFPDIQSITLSGLHKHLVQHASLTLKKLDKIVAARNSENTLKQRRERVLEWMGDKEMNWFGNCVFIDEAGFNMHIRRNFGRSKRGLPAKIVLPSNRGITITIIGAICEKGVIDLTLRKPKAVQKKGASNKKRKRDDGEAAEVSKANARIGTRSEHFLQFISNVMDTLDEHEMSGRYLILDNAAIHKVAAVQELIESRGYKAVYLPPYSPFLNPIELFWSKVKAGVKRDCLTATDNLSARIIESAKQVTVEDCHNWIKHSVSFFDRCLTLEPML